MGGPPLYRGWRCEGLFPPWRHAQLASALCCLLAVVGECRTPAEQLAGANVPPTDGRPYHWIGKNGDLNRSGASPHAVHFNTSSGLSWRWQEEIDVLRAPPLIDDELNIYQTTGPGSIYKFNPDGKVVWHYRHEGGMNVVGAIMGGALFGASRNGCVFALNMTDGNMLWRVRVNVMGSGGDTHTILATNGTIVTCTRKDETGVGDNQLVLALDAANGSLKWKFLTDRPTFNFMAAAPGDGTIVFMDHPGTLYRVWLESGRLVWKSVFNPLDVQYNIFSTGACVIGPNDMVYVVANTASGGGQGVVRAHHLRDGSLAWSQVTGRLAGNQAPAVGRLGSNDALSVVAALGDNPGFPPVFYGLGWLEGLVTWLLPMGWIERIRTWHHTLSIWMESKPAWLWRVRSHWQGCLVAFDAQTGDLRWRFDPEPWTQPACNGDSERVFLRRWAQQFNPQVEELCLPDSWASPAIGGDGTVFAGFMDGRLFAVKDKNGDGVIDASEDVASYATGDAFLGGSAIAPGLLAFTPCGGGMYVFRQ